MLDPVEAECPSDVVDLLLWRNAQRILQRHMVLPDGTCHWCGCPAPCSPQQLAQRADAAARLAWHEALAARNDFTRLLPVLEARRPGLRRTSTRNQRGANLAPG